MGWNHQPDFVCTGSVRRQWTNDCCLVVPTLAQTEGCCTGCTRMQREGPLDFQNVLSNFLFIVNWPHSGYCLRPRNVRKTFHTSLAGVQSSALWMSVSGIVVWIRMVCLHSALFTDHFDWGKMGQTESQWVWSWRDRFTSLTYSFPGCDRSWLSIFSQHR